MGGRIAFSHGSGLVVIAISGLNQALGSLSKKLGMMARGVLGERTCDQLSVLDRITMDR